MKGLVVKSNKGRDKGKLYIVMETKDDYYVSLIDGNKYNFDRPKRKSKKHVDVICKVPLDLVTIVEKLDKGSMFEIKQFLKLKAKEE